MSFLATLCLFGILYAYFGYFFILLVLYNLKINKFKSDEKQVPEVNVITIIVTVRNEMTVILEKIQSTLALRYKDKSVETWLKQGASSPVQLIVASDCSDDDTDPVVKRFAKLGVELVSLPERKGKEVAQKAAIAKARGDIILFTDAKIVLESKILDNVAQHFTDPTVGIVSSVDQVLGGATGGSGEGMYVKYEMMLRKLESSFYSLIGVSGSCFAARKVVAEKIVADIPSDFCLLLEAVKQGFRGVHAEDVIASYKAVKSEKEEFDRKVRTVLRGMSAFFARTEFLDFSHYGFFSWMLASHKLARWLVPVWALILSILLFPLAFHGDLWSMLLIFEILFFILAYKAWKDPEMASYLVFKVPLFLVVTNAGILMAWIKYVTGQRAATWDPSNKG